MQSAAANPSPGFRDHPQTTITVEPHHGVVTVSFSDAIIASSDRAKVVKESGHDPVLYIPMDDVYWDFFRKSDTTSECPFKGQASYWNVWAVGESKDDVMWAYENPYDEMQALRGHVAFYPDRVRIETGREDSVDPLT